jgi:hypothetical protein
MTLRKEQEKGAASAAPFLLFFAKFASDYGNDTVNAVK